MNELDTSYFLTKGADYESGVESGEKNKKRNEKKKKKCEADEKKRGENKRNVKKEIV
jgi:hypothetical protein